MKIKCDWCGSWINDFDQVCPNCGGVNNNYNRHANGVPQTIEELKAWAKEMNLPLEEMRTFIGEDYKGAKPFGIYKDETDGTFVVYKNKEDGTRAVRYKGTDEAYAVNELYQKMKERVAVQKAHQQPKVAKPASGASVAAQQRQSGKNLSKALFPICLITIVAIIILIVIFALIGESGPDTGYYTYGGRSYYYYGDWYEWENDSWQYAPYESWMDSDYESYYDSYSYDSGAEYEDFEDKIFRAMGTLKMARKLTSKEFYSLVSLVRLGISMGSFDENYETVSKLLHDVGTATIMSASDEGLTVDDTDKIRAQYVRESLS